jgi:hypothetical protein
VALPATGGVPILDELGDIDVAWDGASEAAGVIDTAFGLDLSKSINWRRKIARRSRPLGSGRNRRIVVTSAVLLTPPDETFREDMLRPSRTTVTSIRADRGCAGRTWTSDSPLRM